jgi:hypothetical protein
MERRWFLELVIADIMRSCHSSRNLRPPGTAHRKGVGHSMADPIIKTPADARAGSKEGVVRTSLGYRSRSS